MEHVGVEQLPKSNDYNGRCIKILTEKGAKQNQVLKNFFKCDISWTPHDVSRATTEKSSQRQQNSPAASIASSPLRCSPVPQSQERPVPAEMLHNREWNTRVCAWHSKGDSPCKDKCKPVFYTVLKRSYFWREEHLPLKEPKKDLQPWTFFHFSPLILYFPSLI